MLSRREASPNSDDWNLLALRAGAGAFFLRSDSPTHTVRLSCWGDLCPLFRGPCRTPLLSCLFAFSSSLTLSPQPGRYRLELNRPPRGQSPARLNQHCPRCRSGSSHVQQRTPSFRRCEIIWSKIGAANGALNSRKRNLGNDLGLGLLSLQSRCSPS